LPIEDSVFDLKTALQHYFAVENLDTYNCDKLDGGCGGGVCATKQLLLSAVSEVLVLHLAIIDGPAHTAHGGWTPCKIDAGSLRFYVLGGVVSQSLVYDLYAVLVHIGSTPIS
jgi:hypothetical protein